MVTNVMFVERNPRFTSRAIVAGVVIVFLNVPNVAKQRPRVVVHKS